MSNTNDFRDRIVSNKDIERKAMELFISNNKPTITDLMAYKAVVKAIIFDRECACKKCSCHLNDIRGHSLCAENNNCAIINMDRCPLKRWTIANGN